MGCDVYLPLINHHQELRKGDKVPHVDRTMSKEEGPADENCRECPHSLLDNIIEEVEAVSFVDWYLRRKSDVHYEVRVKRLVGLRVYEDVGSLDLHLDDVRLSQTLRDKVSILERKLDLKLGGSELDQLEGVDSQLVGIRVEELGLDVELKDLLKSLADPGASAF